MLKKSLVFFIVLTLFLSGCTKLEDSLSEEEAKELIIEERSGNIGVVEILSIEKKNNSYIIEWENEESMEKGIDKIDKNRNIDAIYIEIE